jgi:IPT/TIG domain-containing protein
MVSIVEVTPSHAPVGAAVKIFGVEFDATPSLNQVVFSRVGRRAGAPAPVISVTPTMIVARVPAEATSGPITITTPNGSATSTATFVVESGAPAPTMPAIADFLPTIGTPGISVIVRGRNFEATAARLAVLFNGVARAPVRTVGATELVTAVPAGAGSGRLTLVTPTGAAVSREDFFVPPAPYTTADVAFTGRLSVGGSARAVSLARPATFALNLCALLAFDARAGDRLSLRLGELTIRQCAVSIHNPDATTLVPATLGDRRRADYWIELPSLPVAGTYAVLLHSRRVEAGGATLELVPRP